MNPSDFQESLTEFLDAAMITEGRLLEFLLDKHAGMTLDNLREAHAKANENTETPLIDEAGIDGVLMNLCQECIFLGLTEMDPNTKGFWLRRASELIDLTREVTEDLETIS